MTLDFPATPAAAKAICMTVDEAATDTRRASILAGRYLRMLGYERKYCHYAWDRGMRWYAPGSDLPMQDATNVTILSYVLV